MQLKMVAVGTEETHGTGVRDQLRKEKGYETTRGIAPVKNLSPSPLFKTRFDMYRPKAGHGIW